MIFRINDIRIIPQNASILFATEKVINGSILNIRKYSIINRSEFGRTNMKKVLDWFERIVIYVLIVLMMVIILMAIIGFVTLLIQDVTQPPLSILNIEQLLDIFGYVLLILIGVELLDTIRAYLSEHVVHVEVVLEVAMIAIARKIIILELKETTPATLVGIAALVASLAVAFYLEKRSRNLMNQTKVPKTKE